MKINNLKKDQVINFLGHIFVVDWYGYLQCTKCNINNVFKVDDIENILYILEKNKGISIVSLTCNEVIIKNLLE